MNTTEILGYCGALLVGLALGLIGGGGSILTVPILVYLIGLNPITATAYSLFVVGATSLVGAFKNFKKGLIDIKTAIIFAIPAFIGVYLTRRFLIPIIPSVIYSSDSSFTISKDMFIMMLFAFIMLLAGLSMIRKGKASQHVEAHQIHYNYPFIAIEGIVVGILTGIVGAGGGFLIIPALVLLVKLPMKKAVGTSLLIITIKSLIGFLGDVSYVNINWVFLLVFTSFSIVGIIIGVYTSKYISGKNLKKGFGYLTLLMAIYIIYKELF